MNFVYPPKLSQGTNCSDKKQCQNKNSNNWLVWLNFSKNGWFLETHSDLGNRNQVSSIRCGTYNFYWKIAISTQENKYFWLVLAGFGLFCIKWLIFRDRIRLKIENSIFLQNLYKVQMTCKYCFSDQVGRRRRNLRIVNINMKLIK